MAALLLRPVVEAEPAAEDILDVEPATAASAGVPGATRPPPAEKLEEVREAPAPPPGIPSNSMLMPSPQPDGGRKLDPCFQSAPSMS